MPNSKKNKNKIRNVLIELFIDDNEYRNITLKKDYILDRVQEKISDIDWDKDIKR